MDWWTPWTPSARGRRRDLSFWLPGSVLVTTHLPHSTHSDSLYSSLGRTVSSSYTIPSCIMMNSIIRRMDRCSARISFRMVRMRDPRALLSILRAGPECWVSGGDGSAGGGGGGGGGARRDLLAGSGGGGGRAGGGFLADVASLLSLVDRARDFLLLLVCGGSSLFSASVSV